MIIIIKIVCALGKNSPEQIVCTWFGEFFDISKSNILMHENIFSHKITEYFRALWSTFRYLSVEIIF